MIIFFKLVEKYELKKLYDKVYKFIDNVYLKLRKLISFHMENLKYSFFLLKFNKN